MGRGPRSRPNFPFNDPRKPVLRNFQIISGLQIHPEAGAGIEIPGEPQSRIWSNPAALVHNFGYSRYRNTQVERQPIHAETERFHEVCIQNLPGVDWPEQPLQPGHLRLPQLSS
jgi:hypothetical protein